MFRYTLSVGLITLQGILESAKKKIETWTCACASHMLLIATPFGTLERFITCTRVIPGFIDSFVILCNLTTIKLLELGHLAGQLKHICVESVVIDNR